MEREVGRSDWVLLFLSGEALGLETNDALDPIRIQKGMFLLSMRGPERNVYSFQAYNWGPFSAEIYADLDLLRLARMIVAEEFPGRSWKSYRPSERGAERARQVASYLGPRKVEWLAQTRRFVTALPFVRLLEEIYALYPEYATKSLLMQGSAAES